MGPSDEDIDALVAELTEEGIEVSRAQVREAVRNLAEIIALASEEGLIDRPE